MDTHPTPSDSDPPTDNNNPNPNNRDQFLRHLTHLNKLSHKITKPTNRPSEPPVHPPPVQQPPVYNISKSDFRDVVQKLTGSPAHAHPNPNSNPHAPHLHAPTPKPNSARLQRIRPPPLAPLSTVSTSGFGSGLGQMSPLPPLPTCHGAAESPISAYMRFFHSAVSNSGGSSFPAPENIENLPPIFASVSPSSPCSLSSPKLILPLSPTVPGVASPK